MQNNHVSCHYVVSTTPTYCPALVDLSRSRSVHAVEHNPCCPDPVVLSASECRAVHYGLCSPLLKLPTFSIPASTSTGSNPNSPTTPKGTSPTSSKGSESPKSQASTGQSSPKTPTFSHSSPGSPSGPKISHPLNVTDVSLAAKGNSHSDVVSSQVTSSQVSKVNLEIFDPVELLAVDLGGKLEALVNSFVAQDKVRLAARKKSDPSSPVESIKKPSKKDNVDHTDGSNGSPRRTKERSPSPAKKTAQESVINKSPTSQLPKDHVTDHVGSHSKIHIANLLDNRVFSSKDGKPFADISQSKGLLTSMSPLKPSPEYQQTGVKAQITMFSSKEKESSQSPVNSLERRLQKVKQPLNQLTNPGFKAGPLSLDELQELLKSTSEPLSESTQDTAVYQSAKAFTAPFENSKQTIDVFTSSLDSANSSFSLSSPKPLKVHTVEKQNYDPKYPSVLQAGMPSQAEVYDDIAEGLAGRVNSSQECVQSPVDYAKARMFQNVQQLSKLEDNRPKLKNGHLVTEAKYRWEHQQWSSEGATTLTSNGDHLDHKKVLTIEGLLDVSSPSIPHPKLTNVQKQHIKERSLSPTDRHNHVPIRPFLTKGSVAERVLLFECCPDRALERATSGSKNKPLLINTWRTGGSDVHNKTQSNHQLHQNGHHRPNHQQRQQNHSQIINKEDKGNLESPRTSLLKLPSSRWSSSPATSRRIPRFHFPDGKPKSSAEIEAHLQKVAAVFAGLNEGKASKEEFGIITKACNLPLYWKMPLFIASRGDEKKTSVTCEAFLDYWKRIVNTCHDEASKFVHVLTREKRNYLIQDDFVPFMQDVINTHPGLTFLKDATEFHSRYIHTVIARIFYGVNRSWSGRITIPELRKSNFLQVLSALEEEEDINQITDYFSYEHFYVIYCKFWELDKDHDLFIDENDLRHHNGGALSSKIIERIFSGAVTRGPNKKSGKMSYTDFVWFLISEEDKRHPRSIEYWFRCMDMDGDGFLSMFELEFFYQEQLQRLDALGVEPLPFNDCLCQMLDIIKPKVTGKISLSDLKKCKMTPIFFDTFFNLEKYLDHEQRDPFASQREHDGEGPELSDWERYAADEYELLVAEEGAAEQQDELSFNCNQKVDALSPDLDRITSCDHLVSCHSLVEDDCDYADTDIDYRY